VQKFNSTIFLTLSHPIHSEIPPELKKIHPQPKPSFAEQIRTTFKDLQSYSFFTQQLVRISMLKDFKRSNIGLLWLFILPILSVISWVMLNGAGIIDPGDSAIPYPAYVLLSTSIWGFFVGIYQSTSNVLRNRGNMITMAHFPHEVLVMEKIWVHLIRFTIPFFINLVVLLLFGIKFTWVALLFPLTLLPLLILGVGMGLIISLFRIVAVDIAQVFDRGIGFLMFLTPVIYTDEIKIAWLSKVVAYNPLTYLVGFSRDVLTQGTFFEPASYSLCIFLTLIFFLFALRIFLLGEPRVIERLIGS